MNEFDQAIQEFLEKGGKIQAIPAGKSGIVPGASANSWGKKKAVAAPVEEIEELAAPPDIIDLSELVEEESAADEDELEE